jgi:hypothetical protein
MTTTNEEPVNVATVSLGQVVVTTSLWTTLLEHLSEGESLRELAGLLERHRHGDFGDVGEQDWEANLLALKNGTRLLSTYVVGPVIVWCITEADRSVTTLLLPEDY